LVQNIKYIITKDVNPYNNLALEEYLLKHVQDKECILYLWQNEKTVVIGKNQNSWKECKITELEEDGGKLVRRLSGGGAVFHDLGNLNFTFLVKKEDYNIDRQLDVIIQAVENLGIHALKTGRNDITVDNRKFSGNAFYSDGTHCYHHGTILVEVDMTKLSKYLNVSKEKLQSKGVESVKSRVINLKEYNQTLTTETMEIELIQAFQKVYQCQPVKIKNSDIDWNEVQTLKNKFSSWDWIYGKKLEFNYNFHHRFIWGDMDLQLIVDSGYIKQCTAYSDAMDTTLIENLPAYLINKPFTMNAIIETIKAIPTQDEPTKTMMEDIITMIKDKGI
jgi:lipoate-protein ligase A